jgi:nitrogen fixation/metabolism regulation signal transduction histidine kinase/HAMP domain-containing protein
LAGAIAFLLTNRITASLSLIGATMQKMNLGAKNQEIAWSGTDEIGSLVKEYNTMVRKLDQSVQSLAKSEREGAWREMARQVAHEIKNPLTPMKLSIQFLQKAISEDAPNKKELSNRMAATLIEQIDQLARIAGDFSQFANIGNIQLNYIDLGELIESLVVLYQANDDIHFYWQLPTNKAIIYADKLQINRLFTNLLQNAIEAGAEKANGIHIHIDLKNENNKAIVVIRDESGGISDLMMPHIFSPNFTTKTAGTGLGLAICKGIVEKANGQIQFTSKEGVGTSFTIQFPLVQV